MSLWDKSIRPAVNDTFDELCGTDKTVSLAELATWLRNDDVDIESPVVSPKRTTTPSSIAFVPPEASRLAALPPLPEMGLPHLLSEQPDTSRAPARYFIDQASVSRRSVPPVKVKSQHISQPWREPPTSQPRPGNVHLRPLKTSASSVSLKRESGPVCRQASTSSSARASLKSASEPHLLSWSATGGWNTSVERGALHDGRTGWLSGTHDIPTIPSMQSRMVRVRRRMPLSWRLEDSLTAPVGGVVSPCN